MIVVKMAGYQEAEIFIERKLAGLNTFGLMEALGATVEAQTKRRIAVEKTAPDGSAWAPLKASTVAKKGSNNILVDTGRLLGSITHFAGSDFAVIGSNVFYGKFHQDGTKKMVARPYAGVSDANKSELERVTLAFITSQLL